MKTTRQNVLSILSSFQMTAFLMIVYGVTLGIATVVEKYGGTEFATRIYYHPLVGIWWMLMLLNWILIAIRRRDTIGKKFAYYLIHASFIFILSGAFLSHFTSIEGVLHLREGEQTDEILTNKGIAVRLPFEVLLEDFQLTRYAGSHSPRSYKSILTIYAEDAPARMEVSMNKVITIQGYRLFQTAYDQDEAGTILTVSHDPIGMPATYFGYLLLMAGILALPFQKTSRLRHLTRQLRVGCLFLCLSLSSAHANPIWKEIQVQNPNGRIEPMDTYCRSIARKIHHKERVEEKDAIEFVLQLMSKPEYWNDRPIIYQGNKEIQESLGKKGKYLSFNDLLDEEGNYRLAEEISTIYNTPSNQQNKRQKDLLKLDEKMNILLSIEQGQILPLFPLPGDPMQKWYSPGDDLSVFSGEDSLFVSHIMPWYFTEPSQEIIHMISIYQQKQTACPLPSPTQTRLELLYNRVKPFFCTAVVNLSCGVLLLLFLCLQLGRDRSQRFIHISRLLTGIIILSFCAHTAGLTVRWYISGQAPWSNAYESMVYAAWCTLACSLLFIRHSRITLAVGSIFAGILIMVSEMNWMDPVITPLVPVLQSYWLMIHVAVIMCGYGFFAIGFLLGLTNLILMMYTHPSEIIRKQIHKTAIINEITLLLGLCLMTAGTFLGAVWANEAWGRYWGWDPKETWALITILIYVAIIHVRFIPRFNTPYALSAMSVVGFSSVLMTYLGVNFFFSGMHSYGSGDAPTQLYAIAIVYAALLALCLIAYRRSQGRCVR